MARNGSAPKRSLAPWRLRTSSRRAGAQWRLLVVVGAVAVLSSTLLTSLSVLVATTEQDAVRGSLATAPRDQLEVRTWLTRPSGTVAETSRATDVAIHDALGSQVTETSSSFSLSEMFTIPRKSELFGLTYFGEIDGIVDHASLIDGAWPALATNDGPPTVAIPATAAKERSLTVGGTIRVSLEFGQPKVPVRIVGIYEVTDPAEAFWKADVLRGAGFDPAYPVPGTAGALATDATGPLVVASGAMAADHIAVERVVVRSSPDFSNLSVDELLPVLDRAGSLNLTIPTALATAADSVSALTPLPNTLNGVASALAVTRGTVLVVGLLVLVLSVAALSQTARLLNESRASERGLLRARGATRAQLVALGAIEALGIAAVAALASPPLSRLVYLAIAGQSTMASARMDNDPGIPLVVWATAAVISVIFAIVIIVPLLGAEGTFHEGQQAGARQRRASGLQRSGIDLAVVVVAAVAYWQLLQYRPEAQAKATLFVDPILVVGPTLILLAGALLSVRLLPLLSRGAERLATRGRGAVVALAAWEVGRRPRKATAAVLLLTLTVSVGTFGLSFLSSWQQSQIDQATFAVGAPVRIMDDGLSTGSELASIDGGAVGAPQPVVRTTGELANASAMRAYGDPSRGKPVVVLGLTSPARAMLDRGRLADEGGSHLATRLPGFDDTVTGGAIPQGATGISAIVTMQPEDKRKDLRMVLSAIVQDAAGTLATVDFGSIYADGDTYRAKGLIPEGFAATSLVGISAGVYSDPNEKGALPLLSGRAELRMRDFSALTLKSGKDGLNKYDELDVKEFTRTPVVLDTELWRGSGDLTSQRTGYSPTALPHAKWPIRLSFTVPAELRSIPMTVTEVAWTPPSQLGIVVVGPLSSTAHLDVGTGMTLIVNGQLMAAIIVGTLDHLPGTGSATTFSALNVATGEADESTIVVDGNQLTRSLVQRGERLGQPTEWWVDVPRDSSAAYVATAQERGLTAISGEGLGAELQQHPVRIPIQAALWLIIVGAALLAAVGFAIHATGNLRSRAIEFAQLRAVGLTRWHLVLAVTIESLLVCVLGTGFGIALGVGLSELITPLVGASASGTPAVPEARVLLPWLGIGAFALIVITALVLLVLVMARTQRAANPATALRWGGDR
jgi:hypothetical protein